MKTRGFTLIELLVVISIIGVLVGLGLPALISARRRSKENACRASLQNIDTGLVAYEKAYGDYPPSGDFVKGANQVNQGGESLVWHLFTTQKGGPFLDMATWENKLCNTDFDKAAKPPDKSQYQNSDLVELADEFKNPFVYIHSRDYAKPAKYQKYGITGREQDCVPGKSAKTGNFHAPGKFMLWSAGSDDTNNNGEDGDIASWNN
jgi:prepilin-type N-terminal cleavage/methylation domain-containing protein